MRACFLAFALLPSLAVAEPVSLTVSLGAYSDTDGAYPNSALEFLVECKTTHADGTATTFAQVGKATPSATAAVTVPFTQDGLPSDLVSCRAKTVVITGCKWATAANCESDYVGADTTLKKRPTKPNGQKFQ